MKMLIEPGDMIKVYDDCFQRNVVEEVVRVENSHRIYNTFYIFSKRDNWQGEYDERLSTPDKIKKVFKKAELPKVISGEEA